MAASSGRIEAQGLGRIPGAPLYGQTWRVWIVTCFQPDSHDLMRRNQLTEQSEKSTFPGVILTNNDVVPTPVLSVWASE
jgi:hypothetical protein